MTPLHALAKLGINYSIRQPASDDTLPLEELILLGMPAVKKDGKALTLLYTWLHYYSDFLNEDRLNETFGSASSLDRAILAGLLSKTNPDRFQSLISKVSKISDSENVDISSSLRRHAESGRCPFDSDLMKFGVKVSELELQDKRKLRTRDYVTSKSRNTAPLK